MLEKKLTNVMGYNNPQNHNLHKWICLKNPQNLATRLGSE